MSLGDRLATRDQSLHLGSPTVDPSNLTTLHELFSAAPVVPHVPSLLPAMPFSIDLTLSTGDARWQTHALPSSSPVTNESARTRTCSVARRVWPVTPHPSPAHASANPAGPSRIVGGGRHNQQSDYRHPLPSFDVLRQALEDSRDLTNLSELNLPQLSRSVRRPAATSHSSRALEGSVDSSSAPPAMPVTTRKRAAASSGASNSAGPSAAQESRLPKRARPNAVQSASAPFDDPFDETGGAGRKDAEEEGQSAAKMEEILALPVIDLVDATTPPKPTPKNEVRLATLQCAICMDDMSNLTATHCGHLFCGGCLHSALTIHSHKSDCPICRQKIDMRAHVAPNPRCASKGYWPLSLKLMTAKMGKRPARTG